MSHPVLTGVCGGSFNATQTPTTISSPSYPNAYPGGVSCTWVIDSGASYARVKIQITAMSLPDSLNCTENYVVVRDQPMVRCYHYLHLPLFIPHLFHPPSLFLLYPFPIPLSPTLYLFIPLLSLLLLSPFISSFCFFVGFFFHQD